MFHRVALVAAFVCLSGCATSHVTTINTGPEIDPEIRSALTEGDLRSVVLIDGESAFWLGGRALPQQTQALTDALLAAPTSDDVRQFVDASPDMHVPGVLRFGPETVMAFRQPAAVAEFDVRIDENSHFVRVVRVPTDAGHRYDVRMGEAGNEDESTVQRLDGTAALDAAWRNLVAAAIAASPEDEGVSPFMALRSRQPLSHEWLRSMGIQRFHDTGVN